MNHATNLSNQELISEALKNNEGVLAANGALSTITGLRTGRSPNDRFIVKENSTEEQIDWGDINKPFEEDKFHALWNKVSDYLSNKKTYTTNVHVGSNDGIGSGGSEGGCGRCACVHTGPFSGRF